MKTNKKITSKSIIISLVESYRANDEIIRELESKIKQYDFYTENPFFALSEEERKLRKYLINANMKINNLLMSYGVLRYIKDDEESLFLFGWYEDYENYPVTYQEFKDKEDD